VALRSNQFVRFCPVRKFVLKHLMIQLPLRCTVAFDSAKDVDLWLGPAIKQLIAFRSRTRECARGQFLDATKAESEVVRSSRILSARSQQTLMECNQNFCPKVWVFPPSPNCSGVTCCSPLHFSLFAWSFICLQLTLLCLGKTL
jgi:hypothetical protein